MGQETEEGEEAKEMEEEEEEEEQEEHRNPGDGNSSNGAQSCTFAAAVTAAVTAVDAAATAHAPLRAVGTLYSEDGGGGGERRTRRRVRLPPGATDIVSRQLYPDHDGWVDTVDGLLRALREGEEAAANAATVADAVNAAAVAKAKAGEDAGDVRGNRGGDSSRSGGSGGLGAVRQSKSYVWEESDLYGADSYIDDFASGGGFAAGASGPSSSIRDRLLELGRSAGVAAPPPTVLAELESFAQAAEMGGFAVRKRSAKAADFAAAAILGSDGGCDGEQKQTQKEGDVDTATAVDVGAGKDTDGGVSPEAPLRKVVLARRTLLQLADPVDALSLVASLRARDPDAYQFALIHSGGSAFVGSTPERLFAARDGHAASEAVAGTRPRGADEGEDAALAYEMLLSPKEHQEFAIVREEVRRALASIAEGGPKGVRAELEKGVLRHVSVQHLYARLGARLAAGCSEADVLAALHPTPAVCGHPRVSALRAIRESESFDRGLYAGPLGWVGVDSAEFIVAIRSALISPEGDELSLYAGVGVVAAADSVAEWRELNLKTRPLEALLARQPLLVDSANANEAWANILVGELVRGGVRVFCVAPGSRSTPLALAADRHPTARVVVCIDERSLGFYALGVGKGSGRAAAVITSSGTAVANLLPAAVEAHESCCPLLLITADRPPEMRDTGANQTIDQTKIFGSFARYAVDLPPPGDGAPARVVATAAAAALRHLHGARPGPVHLNCQFRDPLGPVRASWDPERDLKGLRGWDNSRGAYTAGGGGGRPGSVAEDGWEGAGVNADADGGSGGGGSDSGNRLAYFDAARTGAEAGAGAGAGVFGELAAVIRSARRGLLVVAGGGDASDALAAAEIARLLGWAVAADAASGLRVKGAGAVSDDAGLNLEWSAATGECPNIVGCLDLMLVSDEVAAYARPDVIVQINTRLTSKRVQTLLEAAALEGGAAWAAVVPQDRRADPGHCVSLHVASDAPTAAAALTSLLGGSGGGGGGYVGSAGHAACGEFRATLQACNSAAAREAAAALADIEAAEGISEMAVALAITESLPAASGLFIGNSMPIRDIDMLSGIYSNGGGGSRSWNTSGVGGGGTLNPKP